MADFSANVAVREDKNYTEVTNGHAPGTSVDFQNQTNETVKLCLQDAAPNGTTGFELAPGESVTGVIETKAWIWHSGDVSGFFFASESA